MHHSEHIDNTPTRPLTDVLCQRATRVATGAQDGKMQRLIVEWPAAHRCKAYLTVEVPQKDYGICAIDVGEIQPDMS
ncbi:MAG: hypothetical protein IT444_07990 [Phycisphaeraceae bacterium]|nr:hypothetical protein [Phycisphaeraceae bacterium]